MGRRCAACGSEIDPERLEALPEVRLCLPCAGVHVSKDAVFMEYGHKTAPSLVRVPGRDKEALRRATRAFRRSR